MSENPLDVINTKYCREHVCFKAFRNGVCIACTEEKDIQKRFIVSEKEAEILKTELGTIPKDIIISELIIKKGRGRPKGSKNKK